MTTFANLDALCDHLNTIGGQILALQHEAEDSLALERDAGRLIEDAPTFGGKTPDRTDGVWSWDAARLLVGEGWTFKIIDRADAVNIVIDEENNGEIWWEAAHNSKTAPACFLRLLDLGPSEGITVGPEDAETIRAWASTLPGWSDGPSYARNPLLFL